MGCVDDEKETGCSKKMVWCLTYDKVLLEPLWPSPLTHTCHNRLLDRIGYATVIQTIGNNIRI